jgi:hypothetical protein
MSSESRSCLNAYIYMTAEVRITLKLQTKLVLICCKSNQRPETSVEVGDVVSVPLRQITHLPIAGHYFSYIILPILIDVHA